MVAMIFVGCFYHAFWDIVGLNVCSAIKQLLLQSCVLLNRLSKKVNRGNVMIKIDIKKAFDTVSRDFLIYVFQ